MLIQQKPSIQPRRATAALAAIILLGLALRLWSARGGLWVDEAWSAQFVAQAGSAWGIFWRINHDNNHYLNSLWILLVGPYAPPLLIRAFSILTGTLSIAVAGAIGWRRDATTGLIAALLFAVSPILVAYGAEARGYGPMLLAMLLSVLLIDRWLDSDPHRNDAPPAWALAALTLAGLLAQLTYLFALAAYAGWIVTTRSRRGSIDSAVATTARALGPSAAVFALVVAFVIAAASASTTGFQAGGYPSFTLAAFADVLAETIAYTTGFALPVATATIGVALVAIAALLWRAASDRRPFYLFATIAFPLVLGVALWRIGNAGFARYYLVAVVGLLLLLADSARAAIRHGGWRKGVAIVLTLLVVCASLHRDYALAAAARGDPARAIATMQSRVPLGTTVLVDTIRPIPVLDVAARSIGYPLAIRQTCSKAAFVFIDLDPTTAPASMIARCNDRYRLVQAGRHLALSGLDWALYARGDLPEKRGRAPR
ncbi:hypothetical protein C8J46_10574 [Sphingomonas sp. PP-F2F-A104-K0414]|uniref:hypothetical protein n=1 Tax=Sphingomonas sp. PP-F2F-A104-K0414 TaxID=2135661 RepID=UPI00104ECF74|nr:hypothetical protein [Sphingomonas sp. PP-F2F-A104-K0414]TCP97929.1 hypothetical protein C8J46_10574 [Sphingomonas sp. PP-F2F-A104-K0414]